MTMVTEQPKPGLRCPECGRTNVYHRIDSDTFRCQRCGHVWPAHPGREHDAPEPQGR